MDLLSTIKNPISTELNDFIELFNSTLTHSDELLSQTLSHLRQRGGKRMRPILVLLMAKNFGEVNELTLRAAVGLELLHTASLVHDDVVDESSERRGQASLNASYNNKVAVLVGDYLLSTSLFNVALTRNNDVVEQLSELGRTLARGEILQLSNTHNLDLSEDVYFDIIKMKTAALFEVCASVGASSAGAPDEIVKKATLFGQKLGMIFQIRDDIFDYYNSDDIGKPTGNDMMEGKLTLPVIYALKTAMNPEMNALARNVKMGTVTPDEIDRLVTFTKLTGGIEYAEKRMLDFRSEAMTFVDECVSNTEIKQSLVAYLDYVIARKK